MFGQLIPDATPARRPGPMPDLRLAAQASMRENVFEHLLLGQIGAELLARGVDYDELHSRVDRFGFDVVLVAHGITRHVQVKVMMLGGKRSNVTVSTHLADRPSGCVVWLTYDPVARNFCTIRWFGAAPGLPLPDPGKTVARHTRGNSNGQKAERPDHRVVNSGRFARLAGIAELVDRLFGMVDADAVGLLRRHLRPTSGTMPVWLQAVSHGNFDALPCDLSWETAAPLADLVDGYALFALRSDADPAAFLEYQRLAFVETARWPGNAADLWITLFLEMRAERFGANSEGAPPARLDTLCQQLREALTAGEAGHA